VRYVKKPVPVEAFIWNGSPFLPSHVPPGKVHDVYETLNGGVMGILDTDTGRANIRAHHHYIVGPGAGGEFWPVKKDIFERTYSPAYEEEYVRDRDNPLPPTVPCSGDSNG
jgi:hypothetical protein